MPDNPAPDTAPDLVLTDRGEVPDGWYVQIERQHSPVCLAVGPYPSEDVAVSAMCDSLLVEDLCQTDCLDAVTLAVSELGPVVELVIIDPDEPEAHGPVR